MNTGRLVRLSLLVALAIVLSIVESALSPAMPVPGMKLGLANIVVMYTLLSFDKQSAFLVVISKSLFVFVSRGWMSGVLSFSGGLGALLVIIAIDQISRKNASVLLLSVIGALAHNIIQLIGVTFFYNHFVAYFYVPMLTAAGVIAGIATALLLHFTRPILQAYQRSHRGSHRGGRET